LEKIKDEIDSINKKIGARINIDYKSELSNYILEREDKLFKNHKILTKKVNQIEQDLLLQLKNTKKCRNKYEQAKSVHRSSIKAVAGTGSPSLLQKLDELNGCIELSKEEFLPEKEWNEFCRAMDEFIKEIKSLKETERNFASSSDSRESSDVQNGKNLNRNNPYEILGVEKNDSKQTIKKIYYKLAKIYHPDKGLKRDAKRFKKIKKAYDTIIKQRK
jgi:hypothetical protein